VGKQDHASALDGPLLGRCLFGTTRAAQLPPPRSI
jgi:hypothetical protein